MANIRSTNRVAVIDIEASGLPPGTFPVEVAIAYVDTGEVSTWLIRPASDWKLLAWDDAAEKMHGYSREYLEANGRPAGEVYQEVFAAVDGCTVLSDSLADAVWIGILARAAGHPWAGFEIACIWNELSVLTVGDSVRSDAARSDAELQFPKRHSAAADAARWILVLRLLSGFEVATN